MMRIHSGYRRHSGTSVLNTGRPLAMPSMIFVGQESDVMAELIIAGSTLGIHSGGEGKRTWTGLSFQVGDLFAACDLLRAAGGSVLRQPEDTPEEPAHLAMCVDPEGNEIMLTIPR